MEISRSSKDLVQARCKAKVIYFTREGNKIDYSKYEHVTSGCGTRHCTNVQCCRVAQHKHCDFLNHFTGVQSFFGLIIVSLVRFHDNKFANESFGVGNFNLINTLLNISCALVRFKSWSLSSIFLTTITNFL